MRVRSEFWQNAHVRAMQKIVATHSLLLYLDLNDKTNKEEILDL